MLDSSDCIRERLWSGTGIRGQMFCYYFNPKLRYCQFSA
ncbi:hypothetical protein SLEP1_g15568 [Rubroshorea leprosula]|uniref:Uncharacterized protein n=1 Tax=Rubroshorea leprosula TaxID=152421 RepID=A0AAV5IMT0_9ROSI|nr:hypothetical protein SLEP1_g15568 [Rubroshorea leprosula]